MSAKGKSAAVRSFQMLSTKSAGSWGARGGQRRGMASAGAEEIEDKGKRAGVEFYQFSFVDLFGVQRSKLVPAARVRSIAESGAGFAGFAAHLDMTPADGDLLGIPDPNSFAVLPWNPRVAWLACDLFLNGEELAHAPRNVLRNVLRQVKTKLKAHLKTGVECEFFLLEAPPRAPPGAPPPPPPAPRIADPCDTQLKSCYDAQALMRRFELIASMMEHMHALGWGPYQADHEDANGQFEVNWDYADALQTADRQVLFKYMARSMAEAQGLTASFMPKPFSHLTGSGCHVHVSLHDDDGANLCGGGPPHHHGLSPLATRFLQGVLVHAGSTCALTCPAVNSYKRLHAQSSASGATWSPSLVSWGGNDRTVMVRVPDAPRLEVRLPDMAANPYLLPAAIAAAGLAGAGGKEEGAGVLEAAHVTRGSPATQLPGNLGEALGALEEDLGMREVLGEEFVGAYSKLRRAHWRAFSAAVTDWELLHTLHA